MNTLSWMLYLINTLSNLSIISAIFLFAGGLGLVMTLIFAALEQDYKYHRFDENPLWGICKNMAIALGIAAIFSILLPSKETMLMIVASQIGEQIIQLEEVQSLGGEVGGLASDTIDLLRQNIQEQLTKPVEAD